MKSKIIIAVALFLTIQATAQFNVFKGAGFEINYPASFRAHGAPGALEMNSESVFFSSPDNLVEFYIFSPYMRGVATDIAIKPREKLSSTKSQTKGGTKITWWTITALDGSYSRSYQETKYNNAGNWVIGIKYKNSLALEKYKKEYAVFKTSFYQYGD